MGECNVPTPTFIRKFSLFDADNCSGDALEISYIGATLGCNLPESNLTEIRFSFELDGVDITQKGFLANDTTCSGESSGTANLQRIVCDDEGFHFDFYTAPVKEGECTDLAVDARYNVTDCAGKVTGENCSITCNAGWTINGTEGLQTCQADKTFTGDLHNFLCGWLRRKHDDGQYLPDVRRREW